MIDEKTLDDEVDELKESVGQLRFDVKQEREERRYEANEIRVDLGRVRLEKKEWERSRAGEIEMQRLEQEINHIIGIRWWKPYVTSIFWSNLTTPLNIGMSIMSLMAAGQSSLSSFVSPSVATTLSFTVFVVSLVNTFFTPHTRIVDSTSRMSDWKRFATRFEKIYYSSKQSDEDITRCLSDYRILMTQMKEFMIEDRDLFTDILYSLVSCVKKTNQWMEL